MLRKGLMSSDIRSVDQHVPQRDSQRPTVINHQA